MNLLEISTETERLQTLKQHIKQFSERAQVHDERAAISYENFETLKAMNYPALVIPKKYGGLGISLSELLHMQETIAQEDGATALSIGWHMGITKNVGENNLWDESIFAKFAQDVVDHGALLNNLATEPATGSPTRGGRPETTAKKVADGWVIHGVKSFATLSPLLDYFAISASIEGSEDVGNFLVKSNLQGIRIEKTWDSIAMRATESHHVHFENVKVDKDDFLHVLTPGKKSPQGWLLHIPACYLGIAKAAQRYAVEFANSYSPSSIKGTIADIPAVRQKIGEMELKVLESTTFLYSIAKKWDESDDTVRKSMQGELGAVKLSVVNKALEIVDLAMRIVGARSLSAACPLQRYYRDVRAGLHNPPMDDMTIHVLAGKSIAEITDDDYSI